MLTTNATTASSGTPTPTTTRLPTCSARECRLRRCVLRPRGDVVLRSGAVVPEVARLRRPYFGIRRFHLGEGTVDDHLDRLGLPLRPSPAFRGDDARLNPEQLLVLAASSCQLLSFLAVAARARVDVVAYHDDALGEMPEDNRPIRITRITLRPRITVRGDVTDDRVRHLMEVAHQHCFIANSLTTDIVIEPEIVRTTS